MDNFTEPRTKPSDVLEGRRLRGRWRRTSERTNGRTDGETAKQIFETGRRTTTTTTTTKTTKTTIMNGEIRPFFRVDKGWRVVRPPGATRE
jgi:hypothetical protein